MTSIRLNPSTVTAPRIDAALAILRTVLGVVFAAHGAQKLFVYGFAGVAGAFGQMGIPLPQVAGPGVAMVEFLGGIALVAGIFARPAAALLAATMLVATLLVHLPQGFFNPGGVEFTLTLFAGALALVLTGPGKYSLDAVRAGRRVAPRLSGR